MHPDKIEVRDNFCLINSITDYPSNSIQLHDISDLSIIPLSEVSSQLNIFDPDWPCYPIILISNLATFF